MPDMKRIYLLPLLLLCLGWASCLRPSDSDILASHSAPFENGTVVTALGKATSLKMFNQAFTRLSLAPLIDSARGYTIFAPTDSAFIAAGYTQERLNALSDDSLRQLIMYHIVTATLDDRALEGPVVSIKLATLRADTVFSPATGYVITPYDLYALESGDLYLNGFAVPKGGEMIPASNGNIFPITKVMAALPSRFVMDVLNKQADLSLFRDAILITDSLRVDFFTRLYGDVSYDSMMRMAYWLDRPKGALGIGCHPTLFVPTNKAFNDAGYYNYDDLLQLALSTGGHAGDPNQSFLYSPLDSLVGRAIIYNRYLEGRLEGIPVMALYGDLTRPAINNGLYNVYMSVPSSYLNAVGPDIAEPLEFSGNNGVASMTWRNKTITIPHDADPRTPTHNFVTNNGAVYKIDALFYPIR